MPIIAGRSTGGSPPPPSIVVGSSITGTNTGGGTTATIVLPTYAAGDYLLLVVAGNQSSAAFTPDANATLTEIDEVGSSRRLAMLRITPIGSPANVVITASVSRVWAWCVLNLGQVVPTSSRAKSDLGTNTTSTVEMPTVTTSTTDGHELQVIAAATNSTATWTGPATPAGQTQRAAITTAPGLYVSTAPVSAGLTSVPTATIDRANSGTNRNEQALVAVFS